MEAKREEATRIIHAAAAAAAAVGFLSPLPGADAVLISPIQAALVLKLTSVYEQRPRSAALKAAGYAALGQVMGKGVARLGVALIPGIGSVVRGGVAAGVTEAIGWAVVENLEEGGTP
jgi:GTP-binding protein Era